MAGVKYPLTLYGEYCIKREEGMRDEKSAQNKDGKTDYHHQRMGCVPQNKQAYGTKTYTVLLG
jgi:hypothetical protein